MNENNKKEYQKKPAKWYIASTINSNEINAVKNLQAKIKAIHYEDLIPDVKLIMNKLVKNFYFDENDPSNKPPRSMKNTANTTWSVLGNGKYKKQVVKLENKYPGYIFVQMNMTDESWYAVRNSPKITGLVGSSGSGIKPQPIDNEEVENILNNVKPYNEYAIVVEEQIVGDNEKQNSFGTNENNKDLEKLNSTNLANIKLRIGNTVAANIGSEKIVGTIVAIDEEKKQVILKTTMLGQENELTTAIENISIE